MTSTTTQLSAFAAGVVLFRSTAVDRNPAAPVLFGTIDGVATSLFMAKGTDRKFLNVVQDGKQVGTANVRVVSRGVDQLAIVVGEKTHWATFRKEVTIEDRVALGLDTAKLAEVKAANAIKKAEKAAANDEAAKVAA